MPTTGSAVGIAVVAAFAVAAIGWRTVLTLAAFALVAFMIVGFVNVMNIFSA
jgi:energy-coupling factor transporter transmembrane protein EcfT